MKKSILLSTVIATVLIFTAKDSMAVEKPIGLPHVINGMEVAAVYLQPIEMEPSKGKHAMMSRKKSDIHIEADIHTVEGNKNGFAAGEWLPYLTISYTLTHLKSGKKIKGMMMPMVASDGPHYGDNVKLKGIGKYKLQVSITSPKKVGFGRHTDNETGVAPWFEPFTLDWEFNYLGAGKKGGY